MVSLSVFDQVLAVKVVPTDDTFEGLSLTPPTVWPIWSYSRDRAKCEPFPPKLHVLWKTRNSKKLSAKSAKLHVPTKVHVFYFLKIHVVWLKYMYLQLHRSLHAQNKHLEHSLSGHPINFQSTCTCEWPNLKVHVVWRLGSYQQRQTNRYWAQTAILKVHVLWRDMVANFSKSNKLYVQNRVCQKWSKTTILCHIGVCKCISGIPPCKSVQQILCRKSLIWPIYRGLEISSKKTFFKNLIRHSSQQSPRHIANCWQRAGEK